MPYVPKHPCSKFSCGNLVPRGERFCPEHKKAERKRYDADRGTATQRGYGKTWQRLRRMKLRRDPMCECDECKGQRYAADMVHHREPIDERPDLRLVWTNLMSCKSNPCHERLERDRGKRWTGILK